MRAPRRPQERPDEPTAAVPARTRRSAAPGGAQEAGGALSAAQEPGGSSWGSQEHYVVLPAAQGETSEILGPFVGGRQAAEHLAAQVPGSIVTQSRPLTKPDPNRRKRWLTEPGQHAVASSGRLSSSSRESGKRRGGPVPGPRARNDDDFF